MEVGDSISREAGACRDLFTACVSNSALHEHAASLRSAQGEFNLWASAINATSTGKSSLDHRLRNHQDVREAICDLLAGLAAALRNCERRAAPPAPNEEAAATTEASRSSPSTESAASWDAISNEWSRSQDSFQLHKTQTDPVIAENLFYVTTTLDQLTRISLAIRKAGTKYRFGKVDDALSEEDFEEFRIQLTRIILRAFPDPEAEFCTSEDKIKRASDFERLTLVQKRLVHTNILRKHRIQFITRSRNTGKRARPDEPGPQPQATEEADAPTSPAPSVTRGLASQKQAPSISISRAPQQVTPSSIQSNAPTATDIGSHLDVKRYLTRQTPSKATNLTRIGKTQAYPQCPTPNADGTLVCPYCDDLLPSSYARNEQSWKVHVVQDILPYSCFINECDSPYEMYLTAESLLAHFMEKHSSMRWVCDYCASKHQASEEHETDTSHEFTSVEAWEDHVKQSHSNLVSVNKRPLLAELNKRQMIGPLSCPLCDSFHTNTLVSRIDDHILQHLHEFALWSLPEGPEAQDDVKSKASQVSSTLSHTKLQEGEPKRPYDGPPEDPARILTHLERYTANPEFRGLLLLQPRLSNSLASDNEAEKSFLDTIYQKIQNFLNIYEESIVTAAKDLTEEMIRNIVENLAREIEDALCLHPSRQLQPREGEGDSAIYAKLPPHNSWFIGRDELLEDLEDYLFDPARSLLVWSSNSQPKEQPRVIITGESEVGKTALARQFVYRTKDEQHDCSIFWVQTQSTESIMESYSRIWEMLGSPEGLTDDFIQPAVYYLTWVYEGQWLMILDDIEPRILQAMRFNGWLPSGLRGRLVFTTRSSSINSLVGPARVIKVPKLDVEEFLPAAVPEVEYKYSTLQHKLRDIAEMCQHSPFIDVEAANPRDLTFAKITERVRGFALELEVWNHIVRVEDMARIDRRKADVIDAASRTLGRLIERGTELSKACAEAQPRDLKLKLLPDVDSDEEFESDATDDIASERDITKSLGFIIQYHLDSIRFQIQTLKRLVRPLQEATPGAEDEVTSVGVLVKEVGKYFGSQKKIDLYRIDPRFAGRRALEEARYDATK